MVAARCFQLDDERRFALKQRQHLIKKRYMLLRALKTVIRQFFAREIFNLHVRTRGSQ